MFGEVVGGGDIPAEDDRVIAVGEQLLDQRDQPLELGVGAWTFQCGGSGSQLPQALSSRRIGGAGVPGVGADSDVFGFERVVEVGVEHSRFGVRVDVLFVVDGGYRRPI